MGVQGLTASAGVNQVSLAWGNLQSDQVGGTLPAESFYVEVSRDASVERVIQVEAPASSATISGLKNGITYEFRVFAATEGGSSEPAGPVSATPTTGAEGEVAGIIVGFTDPDSPSVDPGAQDVPGEDRVDSVGLSVAADVTGGAVLVELSEPVSAQQAELIATQLESDPAVAWAEPDQFLFTSSVGFQDPATDVLPEQIPPTRDQLWNVYDTYGVGISEASSSDELAPPTAPVTVAVIDTGITPHPDLDSKLVAGYDFVSNPEKLASVRQANAPPVAFDGDYSNTDQFGPLGRDANPTDPGDWREITPIRNSSWHGTQIAGVIAQIDPNARIQPIRALSWRGGLLSDIAASITWASGGTIKGTPINETPSQVINMSFAVEAFCPQVMQDAINAAHERGVTLIAAAGNANDDATKFTPGNCNNVINVGASNKNGVRAVYSNYGEAIDLSAPGGDAATESPVITTSNNGTTTPNVYSYGASEGTSVASAHVAAAASIIIKNNSSVTPDELYQSLTGEDAVKNFAANQCDPDPAITCGPGILSLAQIQSIASGDLDFAMNFTKANSQGAFAGNNTIGGVLSGSFTIEAWANPNTCASDEYTVATKELTFLLSCRLGTWQYALGSGSGWYGLVGSDPWFDTKVPAQLGQWQHVAITRSHNSAPINFYLNGAVVSTNWAATFSLGNWSASPLSVGFRPGSGGYARFDGALDEVRIYNTNRSASISSDMNSYGPVNTSGLQAYYDFNEGPAGSVGPGTVYNRATSAASSSNLSTVNGPTYSNISTTTTSGSNTVVTFPRSYLTAAGGWRMPDGITSSNVLVVGGGGGGSHDGGGGGGGGGVRHDSNVAVSPGTLVSLTVGAGGAAGSWIRSVNALAGDTSRVSFSDKSYVATGGSGGQGWTTTTNAASGTTSGNGTAGISGSGGAGPGTCVAGSMRSGTNGNPGFTSSIFGSATNFAGGGGGGSATDTIPMTFLSSNQTLTQGSSGGGNGAAVQFGTVAGTNGYFFTAGAPGSRGGGGGAGSACGSMSFNNATLGTRTNGGAGGAGIVVFSYATPTKSGQSITFASLSGKTYGDPNFSVSATTSSSLTVAFTSTTTGVCTVTGVTVSIVASGTCTIAANQVGSANFEAATQVTQGFAVAKAVLTVTAQPQSAPYGTAASVVTVAGSVIYTGWQRSDTVASGLVIGSVSYTTTFTNTSNAAASSLVITPVVSGLSAVNYSFAAATGAITVSKRNLTVTASSPSVNYGDAVPTVTAGYSGFVNSENSTALSVAPSCTTAYTRTSNAGTTPSTSCSSATATNYDFIYVTGSVTIAKSTPTMGSWPNVGKTYGASNFDVVAPTVTGVTGGVLSGGISYSSGTPSIATVSGTTVSIARQGISTFTASFTPLDTTNYNSASTTMVFTVDKAPLTITASSPTVTYGDAVPAITASYSGFVYGQGPSALSTPPACTTTYAITSDAGTSPVTSCAGAVGDNYSSAYVNGAITINKAMQSALTLSSTSGTYGTALTLAVSGGSTAGAVSYVVVNGSASGCSQTSGSLTSTSSGTCTVTATMASDTNYNAVSSAATTVTLATRTLGIAADVKTSIFGAAAPTFTYTQTGTRAFSDAITGVTYTFVGIAPTVYVSSTTVPTAVGSYSITPSAAVFSPGAASSYLITHTASTYTITPGSATKFIVTGSPAQTAGASQTLTITAVDSGGNTATTFTGDQSVNVSGPGTAPNGNQATFTNKAGSAVNVGSAGTLAFTAGVATTSLSVFLAGSVNVVATQGALTTTGSDRLTVSVSAATALALAVTVQPVAGASGSAFSASPVVRVVDTFGNTVTTSTASITASSSGGLLGGTLIAAATGGVATFNAMTFTGLVSGSFTLTFAASSLGSVVSAALQPSGAGAAASLAVNAGNSQAATAGRTVLTALSVLVKDTGGNPVAGTSVTFAVATGGGSLATLSEVTSDSSGVATASAWTVGTTAGANTVSATSGSLSGSPVTFTATGVAGAGFGLSLSRSSIGTASGSVFTTQPQVSIRDTFSNVVSTDSSTVVSAAVSVGGALVGTATATAVNGVATFTNLGIAGTSGTSYVVTYSSGSLTVATQSVTVTVGAPESLAVITAASGAAYSSTWTTQPVIEIRDSGGNRVTGDSTTVVSVVVSAGGTLAGTTTSTANAGRATFAGLSLTASPTSYTLTFSSGALITATQPLALAKSGQSITFASLSGKTYGDPNFSVSATTSSSLTVAFTSTTTGVCTVTGVTVSIVASGTCTIAANQVGSANFEAATQVTQGFAVAKAVLTVTAQPQSAPYGTAASVVTVAGSVIYTGWQRSDTVASGLVIGSVSYTTTFTNTSNAAASSLVITPVVSGLSAVNYSFAAATGAITVSKRNLTVTASSPSVNYGDAVPTVTAGYSGFVNSENSTALSVAPSCTTAYTRTSNAGTTPSTSCSSATATNYDFIYVTGSVTIAKSTPTMGSWPNVGKTYGASNFDVVAPTVTGVTGGVLSGGISYSSGTPSIATVSGTTVSIARQGISTFTASFTPLDTTNYNSASTTMVFTVDKAPLTITASSPTVTYGDAVPAITASYSGFVYGQGPSALSTPPACTTTYAITSDAGTSPVTSCAGAVGDNYSSAYVNGAITINKAMQSALTLSSTSGTYGTALTLAVSGGSTAGAVSYVVVNGSASGCSQTSGSLTSTSSGTCTVTATMASDTNYNAVSSAATTVTLATRTLGIAADVKTSIFGAAAPTFTYTQTGTRAFSDAITGVTYTFVGIAPTVYVSSTTVPTAVGSYSITPSAAVFSPGAASSYLITHTASTYTIGQSSQSITFTQPGDVTYGVAAFGVSPTSTSGLSVTVTSSTTSVCTVTGNSVSILSGGSCTLTANQAGNLNFTAAAPVTRTFAVAKANQATLSMSSPATAIFGQSITLAAIGGSGTGTLVFAKEAGTCSLSGGVLILGDAGSLCQVSATRVGDGGYNLATSVTQTITINRAGQTLAFTSSIPVSPLPTQSYTPTASSTSNVTGVSSGLLPSFSIAGSSASVCSMSAGVVSFATTGSCVIEANSVVTTNFTVAAQVIQTIVVGSLNQNITFAQPANINFGNSSFAAGATASSTLAVAYVLGLATTSSACSVTALGAVTPLAVGTCEIVASQVGDSRYAAAPSVTRSFQVLASVATAPTISSASASDQGITVSVIAPGFTGGVSITGFRVVATPTGGGTVITSTSCVASPCTITGLTNGTAYTVTAAAINSAGTGSASGATGALTPATSAFAVGALAAVPDNTAVDLSWTALTNSQLGGGSFTRYEVSYRVAGTSAWTLFTSSLTNQTAAILRVTGLVNGTSYDFQVVAITAANTSEIPGNTAVVAQYPSTVSSTPRSPIVLASTATSVQFSWQVPLADGGSALTSPNYTVTVTSSTPGAAAVTCTPSGADRFCTAAALSNDALYSFRVVANNRMGASLAATTTYAVPSSDALLSALTLSGAAVLSPVFASGTYAYASSVANSVTSVTVTPTTSSGAATVTVNGSVATSGVATGVIALSVGVNTITVVVAASDTSFTQTYTLTLTRAAPAPAPTPSDGGASPAAGGNVPAGGPIPPPADVVNRGVNGAVLVNGGESVSRLVPNGQDTGWVASMGGFQVAVSMEKADGAPERMSSTGEMQAVQGGRIVLAGSGYQEFSMVEVFMIPNGPTSRNGFLNARAGVAGAVYLGQAQVNASGALAHTFFLPIGVAAGQYVLQINGMSPTSDSLSVNLAAKVLEAVKPPKMRAGFVQRAAFYDGFSDVISVDGEQKLRQLVRAIPKNAKSVQVEITGVSVSLASLDANLDLAQERAKKVANYLKKQGVSGTYTVTVTASFTVDGAERSVRAAPNAVTGPDGKPLTTATINYLVPEAP